MSTLKTHFIPVYPSFQFSHAACAQGLCCPAHLLQESAENIHPLAAMLALQVPSRTFIKKTSALQLRALEERCGCSLPELQAMHGGAGPRDGCRRLPRSQQEEGSLGTSVIPALVSSRSASCYGVRLDSKLRRYLVRLDSKLWRYLVRTCVGLGWGFPRLGGETWLPDEIPLPVASSAREQPHVGTRSLLLHGSMEMAHVHFLGRI